MITIAAIKYHVTLSKMLSDRDKKKEKFEFKIVLNDLIGLGSLSSSF